MFKISFTTITIFFFIHSLIAKNKQIEIFGGKSILAMMNTQTSYSYASSTMASWAGGVRYAFSNYHINEQQWRRLKISCPQAIDFSPYQSLVWFFQYQYVSHLLSNASQNIINKSLLNDYNYQTQSTIQISQQQFYEHSFHIGIKKILKNSSAFYAYPLISLGVGYLQMPKYNFMFTDEKNIQKKYNVVYTNIWGGSINAGLGAGVKIKKMDIVIEGLSHIFMSAEKTNKTTQDNNNNLASNEMYITLVSFIPQVGVIFNF